MASYAVRVAREDGAFVLQADAQSEPVHRLTITHTLGYNPRLRCLCGTSLELDYSPDNGGVYVMTRRLATFLDEHERCEAG